MSCDRTDEGASATNIDAVLGQWSQGDLARLPEGTIRELFPVAPDETEALVMVTQTCDVRRPYAERPVVHFAVVVRLQEESARQKRSYASPRYAPVPSLDDRSFADLDYLVTVAKETVAQWERVPGRCDDAQRRRLARACGRKFSRVALPDDLVKALSDFRKRILQKHGRNSPEGQALALLEEIRVTASPSWGSDAIDVFLILSPQSQVEVDQFGADEFNRLMMAWLKLCKPIGVVRSIDGEIIPLDQLTAQEYVDSDPLDLGHLSE